jgi:hypothetical protein
VEELESYLVSLSVVQQLNFVKLNPSVLVRNINDLKRDSYRELVYRWKKVVRDYIVRKGIIGELKGPLLKVS